MNSDYKDFSKLQHLHFMGIGGISMSTLAFIAQKKGYTVSGSDRRESFLTKKLEEAGISVFYPQKAENLKNVEGVVYTAAISEDNEEFLKAKELSLPMLSRAEYLGGIMSEYPVRIGVSGTHGKSSTTGMISTIFISAGRDPTVANGAVLTETNSAYRLGEGEHFIYEACEYKDSFLHFHPSIAVMLNMEMDHVDYFKNMEQMEQSYTESAKEASVVIANGDDPHVCSAVQKVKGAWIVKVGIETTDADYTAKNIKMEKGCASFDLYNENTFLTSISLKVPGYHQVYNALASAAVSLLCGIDAMALKQGLEGYRGIKRRFEYKGSRKGALIFDDYAHHPTEIRATLQTAKAVLQGKGRLFTVFQPHTYSRTAGLFSEFVSALSESDRLFLLPIYAARETNVFSVSSEQIAEQVKNAEYCDTFEEIAEKLENEVQEGDLVLTMGAGQADKVGAILLEKGRKII